VNAGPGRSILSLIGPTNFFAAQQVGSGGLPLIRVHVGSPRSFLKLAGPIDFGNDRTDHPVSSESPVETHAAILECEGSPRPILKWIGPIIFFAEHEVGGGG